MVADWKIKQTADEQRVGRMYAARNAAVEYTKDMEKKGVEVKTFFYDQDGRTRLSPDNWRVRVGPDELLTMEQFHTVLMLLGYIK